ncbi:AAA family ATPase [Methylobacterium sp. J-048]|uniref:AAA family ATPase n=1 Tax=Methylobacterium sp. J-048 TaxID=2836635 RepID=UPI001FBB19CC|nr:AAA family ATPase [Methylobacterium sp. J-048]MCJ2055507.1 AAA family ATPase [Methylobacterium sp. J-048]
MSIWDRKPPGNQSPYENIGRGGGKIMRPAEQVEPEHVQGCGDRSCPICMPKGGRGGGAKMGGGSGAFGGDYIRREMERVLEAQMQSALLGGPLTVTFDGVDIRSFGGGGGGGSSSRSSDDPARRKLEAEEKRLRGPVEKYFLTTRLGVAWDDVIGNDTARTHLVEAIEHPIRYRELYAHYAKKPTKGVLLYGPPGCGKTMFGKAAASVLAELHGRKDGEASLLSIKGPEIQSPYVGVTEEIIRAVFAYARAYKALHGFPLVVFIDEADAILPSRDGNGGGRALPWEESNVATFLTEMDGLEDSGALVILATNRPEAIDAAILRDGRCDRKIRVERPTLKAAAGILQRALQDVPKAPEVVSTGELALHVADAVFASEQIVAQLATDAGPRFICLSDIVTGAMLVGIVEQAKGNAFRRDLAAGGTPTGLMREDLDQAVIAIIAQNRGLNHASIIQEIAARDGFSVAKVIPEGVVPPRYTVDADDKVVRLQ